MHRPSLLPTVLLLLVSSTSHADEGEWNRFRGPNGTGISNATTVPVRWTEKDYNWRIELPGPGYSSPVVWGNRVFVTCGDPATALRTLLCIDAPTGRTLWKHEESSKTYSQHRDNGYATATPVVDAGGVVITWTTPEAVILLATDLNGHELWRRNLGPFISLQGSGSSPILYQDMVVLANDQEDMERSPGRKKNGPNPAGRSFVIAIDRKTGKTRWQTETKTFLAGYSTPCVYRDESGRAELIFSNTAHGIMAVDPVTGKINWEFGQPFLDRAVISPVVAPGLVIAGHGAGIRGTRCIAVRPGSSRQKCDGPGPADSGQDSCLHGIKPNLDCVQGRRGCVALSQVRAQRGDPELAGNEGGPGKPRGIGRMIPGERWLRAAMWGVLACLSWLASDALCADPYPATQRLAEYRAELDAMRPQFGGSHPLPEVRFLLFGMGSRPKLVYKSGSLLESPSGKVLRRWAVKSETIVPSDYCVSVTTTSGARVRVVEDEQAIWIEENGRREPVEHRQSRVYLPAFGQFRYPRVLRVMHQEILVNVIDGKPVPNYFVYPRPWDRDGAMVATCLKASGWPPPTPGTLRRCSTISLSRQVPASKARPHELLVFWLSLPTFG